MCISVVGVGVASSDRSVTLVEVVRVRDALRGSSHTAENALGKRATDGPGESGQVTGVDDGEDGEESAEVQGHAVGGEEAVGGLDNVGHAIARQVAVICSGVQARARSTDLMIISLDAWMGLAKGGSLTSCFPGAMNLFAPEVETYCDCASKVLQTPKKPQLVRSALSAGGVEGMCAWALLMGRLALHCFDTEQPGCATSRFWMMLGKARAPVAPRSVKRVECILDL